MNSLRTKFLSLGLALVMALAATGCAIRTPATVGHIGSVEIPAGIYLLAQYEAYSTAAGDADLATGETADDVAAVLKAECTGEIGGEQVTTDGADYVARLTLRNLQYYAAVEAKSTNSAARFRAIPPPKPPSRPRNSMRATATFTAPTASARTRWKPTSSTPPRPSPSPA